jgi:DNA transformation protein
MRDEPDEFVIHLLDLLRRWAPVAARRMFGGYGLFRGGIMFGLVADEALFFKTDAGNRPAYEAACMAPFRYRRAGKMVALSFHAVPPDLLEAGDELAPWAAGAYAAALRTRQVPRKTRTRTRTGDNLPGAGVE